MAGFWYLASPYTAHPGGLYAAHQQICDVLAAFVRAGVPAFSPICHTHAAAVFGGLDPRDHGLWMPFDQPLAAAARGCVIVQLPGWEESAGVAMERDWFEAAGKPVIHLAPAELSKWLPELAQ